jgi:hypothetical protein
MDLMATNRAVIRILTDSGQWIKATFEGGQWQINKDPALAKRLDLYTWLYNFETPYDPNPAANVTAFIGRFFRIEIVSVSETDSVAGGVY